jgi:cytochrome c oxidase subunit 3
LPESSQVSAATESRGPLAHHFADLTQQKRAAVLGMWVFIAQEVLFFGGLFATYAVYAMKYKEAFEAGSRHLSWPVGFFNTLVLITSSLTMAMGVYSAAKGRSKQIVAYLLATVFLGSVFLGVKYFEYSEKIRPCFGVDAGHGCLLPGDRFDPSVLHAPEGMEGQTQIFYSLYFAMTGLHALHMIIGIPIILWIAHAAWRGRYGPAYHNPVEIVGLYWHFVDIVWIFLFPLLYLMGLH